MNKYHVVVTGWSRGYKALQMVQIVNRWSKLGFPASSAAALSGDELSIEMESEKDAATFVAEVLAVGGTAHVHAGVKPTSDVLYWGKAIEIITPNKRKLWRAKTVDDRQIEIRRKNMVMIVSLGEGYDYKSYTLEKTQGVQVHIASAGAQQLTFVEFAEMQRAVAEAKVKLEKMHKRQENAEALRG